MRVRRVKRSSRPGKRIAGRAGAHMYSLVGGVPRIPHVLLGCCVVAESWHSGQSRYFLCCLPERTYLSPLCFDRADHHPKWSGTRVICRCWKRARGDTGGRCRATRQTGRATRRASRKTCGSTSPPASSALAARRGRSVLVRNFLNESCCNANSASHLDSQRPY